MRVLLDHCVPRPLRALLRGHEVSTAAEMGWDTLLNGRLLAAAEAHGFEVLLTVDRSIRNQQSFAGRRISLIIMRAPSNDVGDLAPLVPQVLAALPTLQPGSVVEFGAGAGPSE